ncbi:MAG: rod-binding protein [Treponema sp.]|nr:rod-binding protein [Treponema sp.]
MEIAGFGFNADDYRLTSPSVNRGSESFEDVIKRTAQRMSNADEFNPHGSRDSQGIDKDDKLYQLCLELETFLVKNLLTSMRNTVQKSGLVDESFAGKMYEDMLYDEYAKDFTKNASFGLAESAYRQLSRLL